MGSTRHLCDAAKPKQKTIQNENMVFITATTGRGHCLPSSKDLKNSKIVSLVFAALEIGCLATVLIFIGVNAHLHSYTTLQVILGMIITLLLLIHLWDFKVIHYPNPDEKFSLTIQGSHHRKASRSRTTMYGVTVSETHRVDYEKNPDGVMVFFRRVSGSNVSAGCQPFHLPLQGWFTFFHVLITGTLCVCFVLIWYSYSSCEYLYDGVNCYSTVDTDDARPSFITLLVLMSFSTFSQIVITLATYYRAKDCGYCFYCIYCIAYTRWFKHTNAYTEMIQQKILSKHGQRLIEEGDQLHLAIHQYRQETVGADGVVYKDIGPMTAKRYEDQIVLLHLLLAQEHDQVAKQALPEYNLDGKGVPFTLTAHEIKLLKEFAEKEKNRLTEVTTVTMNQDAEH